MLSPYDSESSKGTGEVYVAAKSCDAKVISLAKAASRGSTVK